MNQAKWSFLWKCTCEVMTIKNKCINLIMDSWAQHFVVYWFSTIFFLSYYLLKFDEFIFYFQESYNSRLKERYWDDPMIHLDINSDLWLKIRLFSGPNKNQVYGLFNITTENLRMTCMLDPHNRSRALNLRSSRLC